MKKIILFLMIIVVLIPILPVNAEDDYLGKKRVLVVYEKRFYWHSAENVVKAFDLLLHHFPVETTLIRSSDYRNDMMNSYDAVVYLPMEIRAWVPERFLRELLQYPKPVLWIGGNFEQYIQASQGLGLEVVGESKKYSKIIYKEQSLTDKREISTQLLKVSGDSKTEVLAYQSDGKSTYPLALRTGNLMYFGKLDFRESNALVVADLLHDFLAIPHTEQKQAYIRIEDVHPKRDPQNLRAIADYLYSERVPFMVALIPFYTNGEGNHLTISEAPGFAETIRYMIQKGGTVVLHGYSHQTGNDETGVGFEFWDREKNRPIQTSNVDYVTDRLKLGVEECKRNGIQPLVFEAPHYGMSELGYQVLRSSCSTLTGQIQTSDKGFSTTTFPFIIQDNPYMSRILPENLSYIDTTLSAPTAPLLEKSRNLLVVRDALAGFYFHPYLDLSLLKTMVQGLRDQGYFFLDLNSGCHWIKVKSAQEINSALNSQQQFGWLQKTKFWWNLLLQGFIQKGQIGK